ncbi:MAG: HEAT repeat domain-containing protein, partial [Desulfobacterales bacterium]|nr:HEAT repeat domain-containing protein [Desulfobacterales bacterium]
MNKALFFWIVIFISIALATEAEALGDVETQVAVVRSDAKAKTISEPARQTTVRSADIDTIKKLAGQLANRKDITTSKTSWNEWTAALASAKALIEQQPAGEMHVFEPLFEPIFSKVGWGGIIRRESRTAADLLVRIGKPAVGFLLEKLKSTEARQRWSAIQILTEICEPDAPIVSAIRLLLSDKDDYVRRVAIESLGKLGENARPAAEDLKDAFNDTSAINRIFARAAYIRMGHSKPEHICAIAKYLESHDTKDEVGYGSAAAVAASVLGDLGPAAIIAAPDLTTALNHPQSQIRLNATRALGCIGADSNQAIDALIDRLKNDTSRQVRRSAATSLGRIGPKAQDAIPVLAKVLREADKESRNDTKTDRTGWWVAARAVGQIGVASAIPVLEESLENNDPDIRNTAVKALEKIQQEAKTSPILPSTQPVEKIGEPNLANAAIKAMEFLPAQNSFRGIRGARVELVLDKQEYFLGENILLHYGVTNQGMEPFRVNAGGDYRGAPRHLRFKVVATDAEGKLVEDPYPSIMCMGGLSSGKTLQPGETWWQSLPLMRYCDFHRPGVYKLKVYHDLGWEGFDYWNNIEANVLPQDPHIAPVAETMIKLVMPSKKQAQQVVKHMLTLPRNRDASVGERHREYEDFVAARYPVYLPIVSKLAKRGYEYGLDSIGAMATPEATWMLIQLLSSKHDNISSKAMKLLLKRLPE